MKSNWTADHWTNLALFVATLTLTGLGTVKTWDAIWASITPQSVSTFGLAITVFAKTMYTQKPRDPNVGERRSDPNPTVPVVEKKTLGGGTVVVPAVVENPGRPTEDQPEKKDPKP